MRTIEQTIILSNEPELVRVMESSLFGREGYLLKKVSSGPEALRVIEEDAPVLAVLSIDMDEFGGEECYRRVKNDPFLCLLPIILVCFNNPLELKKCRDAGCDTVIVRPIDSWTLVAMACRLLHIVGRASPRQKVSIPVRWGWEDEEYHDGRIIDINAGGLFIQTETYISPGKKISLRFALPESNRLICCLGKVVWINHPEWIKSPELPPGMGICFTCLSSSDSITLQTFLVKRRP